MTFRQVEEIKDRWIANRRATSRHELTDLEAERIWLESPERRECMKRIKSLSTANLNRQRNHKRAS